MMGHIDMFFPLYTAAQLGHPRARSQLAVLFFETGLFPPITIIEQRTDLSLKQKNKKEIFSSQIGDYQFLHFIAKK